MLKAPLLLLLLLAQGVNLAWAEDPLPDPLPERFSDLTEEEMGDPVALQAIMDAVKAALAEETP
jgi:hypothetical protein